MRVLIVEDDLVIANGLVRALTQSQYAVDHVTDGKQALRAIQDDVYDLVILDLGLPIMDGMQLLAHLRQQTANPIAVLILTAREDVATRVQALDLGADDFLTKPFHLEELEARVRALIRRSKLGNNLPLQCGNLKLDVANKLASINDQPITLSARELNLLETLMMRMGKIIAKEQIMESLCNWDETLGDNAIEVYIHRLRKKIEPSGAHIRTVRGLGYMLEAEHLNPSSHA
ncbi:response regulator [Methylophilus medardicus]|uniref:Response regulator transcription factor n=1 Tax=Methylophilus medardicus TaxID=2588534 RepID=A0A5B8CQV4_9PROT|nr:response regulator transcription factor [Methylophilus medardicus]QDC43685.1 response regulator transcription factor [Methylophilus medardicus]QDC48692.1 response regulator transcription factor [Methylophilus medardicus]QDC52397.1 response regulator transcription factor [Methylophilus medardicus]